MISWLFDHAPVPTSIFLFYTTILGYWRSLVVMSFPEIEILDHLKIMCPKKIVYNKLNFFCAKWKILFSKFRFSEYIYLRIGEDTWRNLSLFLLWLSFLILV